MITERFEFLPTRQEERDAWVYVCGILRRVPEYCGPPAYMQRNHLLVQRTEPTDQFHPKCSQSLNRYQPQDCECHQIEIVWVLVRLEGWTTSPHCIENET
jgi:hypothetical protein